MILLGHGHLVAKGILHRDISINNILIWLDNGEGFLIDLDLADDWPSSRPRHWEITVRRALCTLLLG